MPECTYTVVVTLDNKYSILCKRSLTWYVHKHFRGRLVLDEFTVSFIFFLIFPSTLFHSLMYSRTVFNHSLKYSIVIILLYFLKYLVTLTLFSQVLNHAQFIEVLSYTHSLFSRTQSCSIYWSTQSHSLYFSRTQSCSLFLSSQSLSFLTHSITLTLFSQVISHSPSFQ